MSDSKIYPVPKHISDSTHLTTAQYQEMYQRSIEDSDEFWAEQAESMLDWYKPWESVSRQDYHKAEIAWFEGGQINLSYNCIDRHLADRAHQTAII